MPDILLFGATGYTGRLTAHALAARGADFAIAGRSRDKLEELSEATSGPEVRVAAVGDTEALTAALEDCKVLISCVGPFVELGDTAVDAALAAGVHYVDSTGESTFVERLIAERDSEARSKGIVMAPCFGFDEVPGDVAVSRAIEGMTTPDVTVTYATPSTGSTGTISSAMRILGATGNRVVDGHDAPWRAAQERRWAPLPPPLGPRQAVAFPLALGRLAPLHANFQSFRTFVSVGRVPGAALKVVAPMVKALTSMSPTRSLLDRAIGLLPEGPEGAGRESRFTILAEARDDGGFRNVIVRGKDVYGLTAETLSTAGLVLAEGTDKAGVLSPVQAVDRDVLEKTLDEVGTTFEVHEPGEEAEVH